MIKSVRFTDAGSMGIIEMEGMYYSTVLPPQDGSLRDIYEAWTAAGNSPEPYVPPVVTLPPAITYKTDIWMRCTDEEAEILDGQLATASVKDRRMWDDCQAVMHSSPLFQTLRTAMTAQFGAERTNVILAPSE